MRIFDAKAQQIQIDTNPKLFILSQIEQFTSEAFNGTRSSSD